MRAPAARAIVRLRVSYDGRAFFGSQRQESARTVQAELERAAEEVFGSTVSIYLAGRTDRGVHAAGQVASFADFRPDLSNRVMRNALDAHLPPDVAVLEVSREPIGFHARYSARWREYRYRIWSGIEHPLARGYVWFRAKPLDIERMNKAAQQLTGTHDFASFAGGGEGVPWSTAKSRRGTVRTIYHCSVREIDSWWGAKAGDGTLLEVRVIADGFLPRMMRGIVGTLAEIGQQRRSPEWMTELIEMKDRRQAPMNAPPDGLTLWAVGYEEDPEDLSLSHVLKHRQVAINGE